MMDQFDIVFMRGSRASFDYRRLALTYLINAMLTEKSGIAVLFGCVTKIKNTGRAGAESITLASGDQQYNVVAARAISRQLRIGDNVFVVADIGSQTSRRGGHSNVFVAQFIATTDRRASA